MAETVQLHRVFTRKPEKIWRDWLNPALSIESPRKSALVLILQTPAPN